MSQPKISVIIVTYNSEGIISFCLDSILKSTIYNEIEIIIVDNASEDGTLYLLQKYSTDICTIINEDNLGFSVACNQGASNATGDFLMFLNPDCIVEETTIARLWTEANKVKIGIVGPLLIDGGGRVLPETAREIPSFKGSVNKLLGSPFTRYNQYYRPIEKDRTFIAPVLSGACMMISRQVFIEHGGLDERYFMYGEDIDMSVRIYNSGYKNVCVPSARVIHFKGESTEKEKLEYSHRFYNAMRLYVDKHKKTTSRNNWEWFFSLSTKLAIIFNFCKLWYYRIRSQMVDGVVVFLAIYGTQFIWSYIKSGGLLYYGTQKYNFYYLLYTAIWLTAFSLQGLYFEKEGRGRKIFKGSVFGGFFVLILYAILPEQYRFSRMIIVLSIGTIPLTLYMRYWLTRKKKKIETVLLTDNVSDQNAILKAQKMKASIIRYNEVNDLKDNQFIKITFDIAALSYIQIINLMQQYSNRWKFEFWDRSKDWIFSSEHPDVRGARTNLYSHFHLSKRVYKLHKRIFDLLCLVVLFLPVLILGSLRMSFRFNGFIEVLKGSKTIVGYENDRPPGELLPRIKISLIRCYDDEATIESKTIVARDYAANYTILDDVFISMSQLMTLLGKLNNG